MNIALLFSPEFPRKKQSHTAQSRLLALLLCCLGIPAGNAVAETIIFTHRGTGAYGSIGGNPFYNVTFTITAIGDTTNRVQRSDNVYSIDHDFASILIEGFGAVGEFNFITPTRTFCNRGTGYGGTVGFSRASGSDLFNGPRGLPALANWDMLTSIGPISAQNGELIQWSSPVTTDGGILFFETDTSVPVTFEAVVVPEPEPPVLTISQTGSGQVTISWVPDSGSWLLQETSDSSLTNWVTSSSGSVNPVVISTTNATKCYRLMKP